METISHIVLNANIVVLAQFHNPSILNPDFLKYNGIVDKLWKVSETITTPPFSQIRFNNDVSITVDNENLNISQQIMGNYQESSPIYDIASEYINVLRHVKYTAMGLNWDIVVPKEFPFIWMMDHFLVKTSIPESSPNIEGLTLKMKFNYSGLDANFELSHIENFNLEGKTPFDVIRIRANIHHDKVDSKGIIDKLKNWKVAQEFVKLQINNLLMS